MAEESQKCYSINDEDYSFTELEDAIIAALEKDMTIPVGTIITVWEGDAVKCKAGDFPAVDIESMAERACDEVGECAEDWPDCGKEEESDLNERIRAVVNQWADDHGLHPNFYRISNTKTIKVKLTSESGDYQIVTE